MKEQGIVSVHIGPVNKTRNVAGPVAILMSNATHFLGAYIGTTGELAVEIFPLSYIGSTVWMRHYPACTQLLALVGKLDIFGPILVPSSLLARESEQLKEEIKEEIKEIKEQGDGRRTQIMVEAHPLLEEVRALAESTKSKLSQVTEGKE
jgi:hypothetical protein